MRTGGGECWGGESAEVSARNDTRSWSEEDKRKKGRGEAWRQLDSDENKRCLTVQSGYSEILFRSATGTLVRGGYHKKTSHTISYLKHIKGVTIITGAFCWTMTVSKWYQDQTIFFLLIRCLDGVGVLSNYILSVVISSCCCSVNIWFLP